MRVSLGATAALTIALLSCESWSADVDFVTLAVESRTGTAVVVRVNPDDVLVFKGADPYMLHGRRLIISARTVRVDEPFTIQQFDDSDTPAFKMGLAKQPPTKPKARRSSGRNGADGDEGTQGNQGEQGDSGKNAPMIVLDVEEVLGAGVLKIVNAGGTGGQGQQGSQGGTGGAGEEGANGSEAGGGCKAGGAAGG